MITGQKKLVPSLKIPHLETWTNAASNFFSQSSDIADSAVVLWHLNRLRAVGWQGLAIAEVGAVVEGIKRGKHSPVSSFEIISET